VDPGAVHFGLQGPQQEHQHRVVVPAHFAALFAAKINRLSPANDSALERHAFESVPCDHLRLFERGSIISVFFQPVIVGFAADFGGPGQPGDTAGLLKGTEESLLAGTFPLLRSRLESWRGFLGN
jgi:hypothetical protein